MKEHFSVFYKDLLYIFDNKGGWIKQSFKFVEETSECNEELARLFTKPTVANSKKFAEELADIFVVGYQLLLHLDREAKPPFDFISHEETFWKTIAYKIARTKREIEDEKYPMREEPQ